MSCYSGHRRTDGWAQMQQMQQWAQQVNQRVDQQVNRNVRVGDAERDLAAAALGDHFSAGRLDRDEYDERLDAIFRAKVGSDLSAVFRDLPQPRLTQQRRPTRPPVRPRTHIPFLPVMLIVIGLMIFTGAWWLLWVGLGAFLLTKKFSHARYRSRMAAARYGQP